MHRTDGPTDPVGMTFYIYEYDDESPFLSDSSDESWMNRELVCMVSIDFHASYLTPMAALCCDVWTQRFFDFTCIFNFLIFKISNIIKYN